MSFLALFHAIVIQSSAQALENQTLKADDSSFQISLDGRLISFDILCLGDCFGLTAKSLKEVITSEGNRKHERYFKLSEDLKICDKFKKLASLHYKISDGWIGINFDKSSDLIFAECLDNDVSFFILELHYENLNSLGSALNSIFLTKRLQILTVVVFTKDLSVNLDHCLEFSSDFKCLKCRIGYYLDIFDDCSLCLKDCLECEDKELCSQCVQGFYIEKGLCLPCDKKCATCTNFESCLQSYSEIHEKFGRALLECNCKSGCYKDFHSTCNACKDFCDVCDSKISKPNGFYHELSLYVCDYSNRCYSNCLKCDFVCLLCKEGFSLEYGSCKCTSKCEICYPGCDSCEDYACSKCKSGFYLVSWSCLPCDFEYCSECSAVECFKCQDGYYVSNKNTTKCLKCPNNCKICSDSKTCRECIIGWFFDSGYCIYCGLGCLRCSEFNKCTECAKNYYFKDGMCKYCGNYCLKCLDENRCQECDSSSYLISSKCINCNFYYFGCKKCLNETYCLECSDYYYLKSGKCLDCGSWCKKCLNKNVCLECLPFNWHHYLEEHYQNYGSCNGCIKNCFRCLDQQTCIECYDYNYFFHDYNSYFLHDESCLNLYISKCRKFSDLDNCTECFTGYYLDSGKCIICGKNCLKCLNVEQCLICSNSYYFNEGKCKYFFDSNCIKFYNKTYCLDCKEGYYSKSGNCLKCIYPCLKCLDIDNCLSCDNSYDLIGKRCNYCNYSCSNCLNITHCDSCINKKMYLTSGMCDWCGGGCLECTEKNQCTKCDSGYYLISGTCYNCNNNCEICKDGNLCIKCFDRTLQLEGSCFINNLCSDYLENNQCRSCYNGYYLLSGICFYCGYKCQKCSSKYNCTQCYDGFYLNSGICYRCREYCYKCEHEDDCKQCHTSHYLYLGICHLCSIGCRLCLSENNCQECFSNYNGEFYSLIDGKCFACYRCIHCLSDGTCTSCYFNQYLIDGECYYCYNCDGCSTEGKCTRCYNNALLINGECIYDHRCSIYTNEGICSNCHYGYFLKSGNCLRCKDGCLNCNDEENCNWCSYNYYLESGKCFPCNENCSYCRNGIYCENCMISFYNYLGSCYSCPKECYECLTEFHCTRCKDSYVLFDMECIRCPLNCKVCSSFNNCIECISDHYYLKSGSCYKICPVNCFMCQNDKECITCFSGFFLDSGICRKCKSNCWVCGSIDVCLECRNDGYYLEAGSCYQCDINCKSCISLLQCLRCNNGFYIHDGICLTCNPGTGWIFPEDILNVTVNNEKASICFNQSLIFSKEEKFEFLSSSLELIKTQDNCLFFNLNQNFEYTEYIELNITDIKLEIEECNQSKSSQAVKLKVNYTSEKPKPEVHMNVTHVSVPSQDKSCKLTKEFTFDGSKSFSRYQKELNYSWAISTNSEPPTLHIGKVFKKKMTDVETLSVNLTVRTSFDTFNTTGDSWTFKLNKDLIIEMGDSFNCKKSMDCEIFIDRLVNCSELKSLKYSWRIDQIGLNENKSSLVIKKSTLETGSYECVVSVSYANRKASSKNFTIVIIPEPLKIILNRSPGTASSKDDLIIDASESYNPNSRQSDLRGLKVSDNTTDLLFTWDCLFTASKTGSQKLEKCPNNEKSKTSKLVISKEFLKVSQVSIRLNATSDDQCEVSFFNASISSERIPVVNLFELGSKEQPKKLPIMKPTVLVAEVDSLNDNDKPEWHINKELYSSGYLVEVRPDKRGLTEGESYKLWFSLKNESRLLEFYYEFQVNKKPEPGKFYVSPGIGEEFNDFFLFYAEGWTDADLPLRYYFAYGDQSGEVLLKMSLAERYSTVLAMLSGETFAFCRVYDALDDFTSQNQSLTIKETNNLENIVRDSLAMIEPPSSIPAVITNILTATLIRSNNKIENNSVFFQEIFESSLRYSNEFIEISSPSDFFINQSLNLVNLSTFNSEITQKDPKNIDSGLALTETLLVKITEIGISDIQAERFFGVVFNIQQVDDEIIMNDPETLKKMTDLTTFINIQTMKRMSQYSNITISSKSVDSFISVIETRNRKDLISGLRYSARVPADIELNIDSSQLLGFVHTQIAGTLKNSHKLVSVSLFEKVENITEISVNSTNSRIVIQIPVNRKSEDAKKGNCFYFDEGQKEWRTEGCKKIKSDDYLESHDDAVFCSCNHLTTFGYGVFKVSFDVNHGVEEFTELTFSLPGFILPTALIFAFIITLLRAKFYQQKPLSSITTQAHNKDQIEESVEDHREKEFESHNEVNTTRRVLDDGSLQSSLQEKNIETNLNQESEEKYADSSVKSPQHKADPDILLTQDDFNKSVNTTKIDIEYNENTEENKDKSIALNDLSELDKPVSPVQTEETSSNSSIVERVSKIFIFYSHHCHIVSVVILNKPVQRQTYEISKVFLILFLEILFDALFYDYNYERQKVKSFEKNLEDSFLSFNLITVLFTAGVVAVVKVLLFIVEELPVKRTTRFRFVVLQVVFLLTYGYIFYKVSCVSTAFGEKISRVWVFCCLISITTEVFLLEPVSNILAEKIQKNFKESEVIQRLYRNSFFWRMFRCQSCKECNNCKAGLICESCSKCPECTHVV